MLCTREGLFVKNRSSMFVSLVGVFTICSRLNLTKFSMNCSYKFLCLQCWIGVSFVQSMSGRLKSPSIHI